MIFFSGSSKNVFYSIVSFSCASSINDCRHFDKYRLVIDFNTSKYQTKVKNERKNRGHTYTNYKVKDFIKSWESARNITYSW